MLQIERLGVPPYFFFAYFSVKRILFHAVRSFLTGFRAYIQAFNNVTKYNSMFFLDSHSPKLNTTLH